MSLLQISEPNQSPSPHQHRYALGIDLGTTHSLIAVVRSAKSQILPLDEHESGILPSVVYYGAKTHAPIVGKQALSYADPKNTIISAKRFMGRSLSDIKFSHPYALVGENSSMPSFVTEQGQVSPVEVSAQILRVLHDSAKSQLPQDSIAGVVITVPAYFDEAQRQATKDAGKAAGLEVLRLLNEPTAAALAYGLDQSLENKKVLVYDLGGGTFDVSVLALTAGVFEVLATGGNSALGGDDIDRLIANYLAEQVGLKLALLAEEERGALVAYAKNLKERLSDSPSVMVDCMIDNKHLQYQLNQTTLANIISPVSERTFAVLEQVLKDAGLQKHQLDEIILVGGSTRMPMIQKQVQDFFGKAPLCHINPDEVVALGAAILANQLINKSADSVLLLDVTPLSLGIETMGGLVEVIIPRNTPIPITKRQEFTTHSDNQTGMIIHVVQGERERVQDCRSLAKFELYGIPPMKAGLGRVEVTFSLDVNGQLSVSATELSTKTSSQVLITPSNGLSEAQQAALLKAGFMYAEEDKRLRMLIESKVEAQRELNALASALTEFGYLLGDDEKQALSQAMQLLKDSLKSEDKALIDDCSAKLKPHSDYFASLIMNRSVKEALTGTTTEKWH